MNLDIEKALRGAAPTRRGASDDAAARFLRRAGDEAVPGGSFFNPCPNWRSSTAP